MAPSKKKTTSLREACVQEALAIVDKIGVEELSLREVARRLGVSHQAPYKHFKSRNHLLAEIVGRAYASFAEHLEKSPRTGDPRDDLRAMGQAYLEYAARHPLQYRLMFSTPLPDPNAHPEMMRNARHAFALLQSGIKAVHDASKGLGMHPRTDFDALFIWFTLHGLCGVTQSHVIHSLNLSKEVIEAMPTETFERFGWMLDTDNEKKELSAEDIE